MNILNGLNLGLQNNILGQFSGNLYEDALNDALSASSILDTTLNSLWEDYILSGHPIWLATVKLGKIIALPLFAINMALLAKKFLDEERMAIGKTLYAFMICILLGNNGQFLGALTFGMFAAQDSVGNTVITELRSAANMQNSFVTMLGNKNGESLYTLAHSVCGNTYISDNQEYVNCMQDELTKAQAALNNLAVNQPWHTQAISKIQNLVSNLTSNAINNIKYIGTSIIQAQRRARLYGIAVTFNVMSNITLLLFTIFSLL